MKILKVHGFCMQSKHSKDRRESCNSGQRSVEDGEDQDYDPSLPARLKRANHDLVQPIRSKRQRSSVEERLNVSDTLAVPKLKAKFKISACSSFLESFKKPPLNGSNQTDHQESSIQSEEISKEYRNVGDELHLNIAVLSHEKIMSLRLPLCSTVFQLKERVESITGISPSLQILVVHPRTMLQDSRLLQDCLAESHQKIWLIRKNVQQQGNCDFFTPGTQSVPELLNPHKINSESLTSQRPIDSLCSQLSQHSVAENNCFYCGNRIRLNFFSCKLCKYDFCLLHRHPEVHSCIKISD